MDEKIEVNDKTVIDLAKIIHKHYQHIKADWEEYTKSDVALAYAIKWNGYRKESDTAREILTELLDIGVKDEDYKMFFLDVCEKLEKFAQKYCVNLGE